MPRPSVRTLLLLAFFFCIFAYYLSPLGDADLPWHLKTGEYILHDLSIPKTDRFSYSQDELPFIGEFILSQYWLSQVVLFSIFDWFGPGGLAAARALLMTGIIFLLWGMIRGKGLFFSLFILGAYTAYMLHSYTGVRPALFTLFFSAVLFRLIAAYITTRKKAFLYPLPPLMILWANMHGGYIFGDLVLGIVVLSAGANTMFKGHFRDCPLRREEFTPLLGIGLLAILCSLLNPNGWDAFHYAFTTHSKEMFTSIVEYRSPLSLRLSEVVWKVILEFWLTFFLSVLIVIISIMRRQLLPALLVAVSAAMALEAIRYIPFMVINVTVSVAFLDMGRNRLFSEEKTAVRDAVLLLLATLALGVRLAAIDFSAIRKFPESGHYSVRAADFLEKNNIDGNIFASYNKAAYLMMRLYPRSRLYMDSRFLSHDRMERGRKLAGTGESTAALLHLISRLVPEGLPHIEIRGIDSAAIRQEADAWQQTLDSSGTEIVVHEALNIFGGELQPIVLRLALHADWKLVYADGNVLIFLKNIERFRAIIDERKKPMQYLFDQLVLEGQRGASQGRPDHFLAGYALGVVLQGHHDRSVAGIIDRALARDPQDVSAGIAQVLFRLMERTTGPVRPEPGS